MAGIPKLITVDSDGVSGYGGVTKLTGAVDEESNLLEQETQRDSQMNGENGNHHHHNGNSNDNHANGSNPTIKPMDHLVFSRRRNICWSVSLLVFFLGLIGSLAVWRFQHDAEHSSLSTAAGRAEHAQVVLNKHFKTQSRTMAPGCEATVLILRHCEKNGPNVYDEHGNQHCSYVGMERAQYLQTLFPTRWPIPSFLFALTPDRGAHLNFREYETLRPLSLATNTDVTIVDPMDLPPRVFNLLHSGSLCGRLVVISWKHEYIPGLATALGCGPDQGCPTSYPSYSYDQVWQLKYVFRPTIPIDVADETRLQNQDDDDDDDDDDNRRRSLRRKNRQPNDGWFIYGSIQHQNFDPLSFSASVGDYATQGVPSGGRWKDEI